MLRSLWLQAVALALLGASAFWPSYAADTAKAEAASPVLPIELFIRPATFSSPKLSPDGRHIALIAQSDSNTSLAMIAVEDQRQVGHLTLPPDNSIIDFDWASDSRIVVSLGLRYGSSAPVEATGELAVVNVDGSGFKLLFGSAGIRNTSNSRTMRKQWVYAGADVVNPLINDPDHVAIQTRKWINYSDRPDLLFRLNLKSGEMIPLAESPEAGSGTRFLIDSSGHVRYAVTRRTDFSSRTWQRVDNDSRWEELKVPGIRPPVPLRFSADGRSVYQRSYEFGTTSCLVEHVLASNERHKLACDERADLDDFYLSFDSERKPIAAVFAPGKPEVRMLDEVHPHQQLLKELQQAFPGREVVPYSMSRDGEVALLFVHDDRTPGDYYLFHPKTRKADYFAGVREWIDPELMSERRPFSLKARDGTTLWGFLTLPRGLEPKRLPLVVNPHGGPFRVRDEWAFDREAQLLASRGYAVLQVNFRGSGGYGYPFLDAGKKAWSTTMIDDITDAVRWSIAAGYVDEHRICAFGGSYGAFASLMSAIREPELYRCVIAAAGVYDLRLFKKESDVAETKTGIEYLDEAIGSSVDEQIAQSPISYLDRLKAPVFIIHGKDDARAPLSQAEALRSALDERKLPYEWLVKAGEGHGFQRTDNLIEMYTKLFAFLDRHLAVAPVDTTAAAGN